MLQHPHRGPLAAHSLEPAGAVKPRPPARVVSIEVPALGVREAEALIDLIEQIQGALWDTYGDAILDHAADDDPPGPGDDDLL